MSALHPTVASALDNHPSITTDDEDVLIAALEEDDTFDAFREQRLQQLHAEFTRAKSMRNQGGGSYVEINEEKELMDITTSTNLCVVHFFKPDFGRCRLMDSKLDALASKHFETRFLRINVDNAPFLVTKLRVQVLPCVIAFVDSISTDRITGFEGLGRGDSFTMEDLEHRLLSSGVLVRAKMNKADNINLKNGRKRVESRASEEGSDDDWD
ncbi:MAG: hypothetical protein Q9165_004635 [Trypethelium subeluteriae]